MDCLALESKGMMFSRRVRSNSPNVLCHNTGHVNPQIFCVLFSFHSFLVPLHSLSFFFSLLFLIFSASQLSLISFPDNFYIYICAYLLLFLFPFLFLFSIHFLLSSSHFSFNFGSLTLSYSLLPSVVPLLSVALFFTSILSSPFPSFHSISFYHILSVHCILFARALWFCTLCPTLTDYVQAE